MKLLFSNEQNAEATLAVTFTNKATEEMKKRILGELYKLSMKQKSDYLAILQNELKLSELEIHVKAKHLLEKILHNYSKFSIETIDSFFQKVVRSFAKELGIYESINLELDNSAVLDEATELLLRDIGKRTSLKNWLMQFIQSRMEENKGWKVKGEIQTLAQELFKEDFRGNSKTFLEQVGDKDLLNNYLKELRKIVARFRSDLKVLGEKGNAIILDHQLEKFDFKGGKNSFARAFTYVCDGKYDLSVTTYKAVDVPENWYAKKSIKTDQILVAYHGGLNDCLSEILQYISDNEQKYYSSLEIQKHFHTLGLLGDISISIKETTNEKGVFLLSDTSRLLYEMIKDTDAPFIYEKIGHRYKHILIDEFQDTSTIQWQNFKPLLNNSLSEDNLSLVVGDVKQSIYRWRNGDWKILASDIYRDFQHFGFDEKKLKTNYRSRKNVVHFNNTIFTRLPEILSNELLDITKDNQSLHEMLDDFRSAFKDTIQELPKSEFIAEGFVRVEFVEGSKEAEWKDNVLTQLPELIRKIQDKGFKAKDIAFLTRTSGEGNMVARQLLHHQNLEPEGSKYNFNFISNDTLFLSGSTKIKLIIAVLAYFNNADDSIARAEIVQSILNLNLRPDGDEVVPFDQISEDESFAEFMPEGFAKMISRLQKRSIYENIELIIDFFELNQTSEGLVFLEAFQDWVNEVNARKNLDLNMFLEQWIERGRNVRISMPVSQDAMQITTIHKSKGIEYKVVIIPFCNWNIEHEGNISNFLWCKPDLEPFNQLDLIPVRYSANLQNTIFIKEYLSEKIKSFVDNLNLLYVSLTRACDGLFIFAPQNSTRKTSVGSYLKYVIESRYEPVQDQIIALDQYYDEAGFLEIGTLLSSSDSEDILANPIDQKYLVNTQSHPLVFKPSNTVLFDKQIEKQNAVAYGNFMHELFARIEDISDLAGVIREYLFSGMLTSEQAIKLESEIAHKISQAVVCDWFHKDWDIRTEDEILVPPGKTKIPDRVMIKGKKAVVLDYKFGDKTNKTYNRQVNQYTSLLEEMGFSDVVGYIWYYHLDIIERI